MDADGEFSIEHDVRGEVEDYGTFPLTEGENSELWNLVGAADIEEMRSLERAGAPDEVQYTFVLGDEREVRSVQIWIGDARQNDDIVALVDYIAILIEKYTGERPIVS